jgi:hypothetical protein
MARVSPDPVALLAFHFKANKLPPHVAELAFAKPRQWRFDFAWPELLLAVEVEGGTWSKDGKSRHTTGSGFAKDCEKYNSAALLGWKVLRFPSDQVRSGEAVALVKGFINGRL